MDLLRQCQEAPTRDERKYKWDKCEETQARVWECQWLWLYDNRGSKPYPQVSPQVGTVSPSHMKLPANAQMEEINNVAGTKTVVPMTTGLTNTLKRSM